MHISTMAKAIHNNAISKGFAIEGQVRPVPELLCLIHSEISEALEAYRNHDDANLSEELADAVIRLFDTAEELGIDIEEAIIKKHNYNQSRPYKHGGKKC